jgi:hypothetical protein
LDIDARPVVAIRDWEHEHGTVTEDAEMADVLER